MATDMLSVIGNSAIASTAIGRILRLRDDGLIEVATQQGDGKAFLCETILLSSGETSHYQPGDKVVFTLPEPGSSYGCVLGRIGRYHPTTQDSTDQKLKTIQAEEIAITASTSLVLKCGKGSLSIDKDGTIIIKGARVLSRSTGVNKIKGASVLIN